MPALGADMEAGTIIEWLVKPGDAVKRGDIIAVVDTEKATIEVEVFETGIIQNIVVAQGEKVPIGTVLALISTDGEVVLPPTEVKPKPAAAPPQVAPPPMPQRPPAPPRIEKTTTIEGAHCRASSLACFSAGYASGVGPENPATQFTSVWQSRCARGA
jgi:pyruvate dehydrogenase E2 component (dihydrolipoamide acetyltransferase)